MPDHDRASMTLHQFILFLKNKVTSSTTNGHPIKSGVTIMLGAALPAHENTCYFNVGGPAELADGLHFR